MSKSGRGVLTAVAVAATTIGAAPARAAEQQAYAVGFNYATPAVAVAPGDTLRFNNLDPVANHNLVSDTPGQFASAIVASNGNALVAGVEKLPAGTYQFHCTLHPWMHGAIEVAAGAGAPPEPPGAPAPGAAPDPVDLVPHAAPAALTGGDWPLYGHDLANTRDGGTNGPSVDQVPFLSPGWSLQAADGDFSETPVESGGAVVAVSG